MGENRSVELIFRLRTEGREQAEAALRSIKGLSTEIAKGSGELSAFDAGGAKVAARFGSMDQAAKMLMSTLGLAPQSLIGFNSGVVGSGNALSGMTAAASGAGGAIGAVATVAVAVAAKLFNMAQASASLAQQQSNLAARTGLTIKEVGLFTAVAEDAGLSTNAYTSAMRTLSMGLSENSDEGRKAKRGLAELGITTHDQFGQVSRTSDLWRQMADRLGALPDGANKSRIAIEIMGRSGLELLPQLNGELKKSLDAAERMGAGFDEAQARSALAFDKFLSDTARSWKAWAANTGVSVQQFFGFGGVPGMDAAKFAAPSWKNRRGVSKLLDFDQANNDRDLILGGGTPILDIDTRPKSLKSPDLTAFGSMRDRERIFALTHQELDLTEKLSEAKKNLAESTNRNDLRGVEVHVAEVQRLEAAKKSAEAAKKSAAEYKQALEAVMQLETRAFSAGGPQQKILADRTASLQKYGTSPALTSRINDAYDSLSFDADLKTQGGAQKALASSRKTVEKNFRDIALKHEEVYSQEFITALHKDEQRLKIEFDRLGKRLTEDDDSKKDSISRRADAASRRFSLNAGPTGAVISITNDGRIRLELAKQILNIETVAAERHATEDERQLAREKARHAYRKATEDASLDAELKLLELRQRSNEQYRESAGRVYDALRSGGTGGLKTLITGTADVQGRALFQNISSKLLQTAGSTLGGLGAASGLPSWLLRGTLADPQNAEIDKALALDKNTTSLKDLTTTLQTAAGSASIGRSGIPGLGGGGIVPGFLDSAISSGKTVASFFPGSATNSKFGAFGFGASTAAGGLFAGLGSGQIVRGDNGYVLTGSEKFGNVVGSAGIVAGAAFGVYSGIKQGGPRGIATAVGAGLGALAAIPGAQQPFVAAAALVAGLVTGLLPDPKKQREEEINRAVTSRRFEETKGTERNVDLGNNTTDYDGRGRVRVINNFVINALDARSLMDRKQDIAQAVSSALVDGGNDLGDQVRAQVSRY